MFLLVERFADPVQLCEENDDLVEFPLGCSWNEKLVDVRLLASQRCSSRVSCGWLGPVEGG